jgi:hypothetical protein
MVHAGMKALSLWQPWASAIPMGLKSFETRGWSTKYRGPLAVHAAKRWDRAQQDFADTMGMPELPFGQVIATCVLACVIPTEHARAMISDGEFRWGVYDDGRFAWLLTDIIRLRRPFPFKGGQGFFNVPDDQIEAAL